LLSLDKDVEMLADFGLTTNQAKVYLAIVQLGIAPIGRVSKASKVRREDVYRILPKLEKIGLIEKIIGTPNKVRAIPVEEALSILIKHEQETADQKLSALMAKKDELLKHLRTRKKEPEFEEEAQFAMFSEREAIINKLITMMKKAEKEIDIITSADEFLRLLPKFKEGLDKAVKKKLKVRIILEVRDHESSILRNIEGHMLTKVPLDLRYAYQSLSHYTIVDYTQVLMATSPEPPLGEYPYLWTSNKGLVGLMQEGFEETWHTCMNAKTMETEAVSEKVASLVGDLRPTNHVIFLYQSSEAKHNVLFNYLKFGLENGEAGVYVASEEDPNKIRDAMKAFGLQTEKYEKTGALRILGCSDVYIIDGEFDMSTTMSIWNKLYSEALAKGFKGLRVTGEMACFFEYNLLQEMVEYETALHKVLDVPMIAICAYNSKDLTKAFNPINLYNELVRAHGTVVFAGLDNTLGKIEIRKA